MRLEWKILLVSIGALVLALLLGSIVNIASLRPAYTDTVLKGTFSIGHGIETLLKQRLAAGLPLESLSAMDEKLKQAVEKNPYIEYLSITDLTGLVLSHTEPSQIGRKYSDSVTLNTLGASEPLWQIFDRFDGESYYDVAIPVIDEGQAKAVIRLGYSSEVIDEKVISAVSQVLINFLVSFVLVFVFLYFILRGRFVEPLKQVTRHDFFVAEGGCDQHEQILGKDRSVAPSRTLGGKGRLEAANSRQEAGSHELKQALEREIALTEALRLSEERFRMLFEANKAVMLAIDPDTGNIIAANEAAVEYYGYTLNQLRKLNISDINTLSRAEIEIEMQKARNEERSHFVFQHALATGEVRDVEVYSGPFSWDGEQVLYSIVHDITDRKKVEAELEHIANYDPLTGLPNRRLKTDRLRQAIAFCKRNGTSVGVCYLDLDGFKPINDRFGHDTGDRILVEIARRLQATLRDEDTVSRIGGDEFVLILVDLVSLEECILVLDRVLEVVAQPIQLEETILEVNASIGLTLYPEDDVDADMLLRHADQAMYWAKEAGKNCYHLFDPQQDRQIKANRENFLLLKSALENREFVLYYQPKVDMYSSEVVGVEALVRWMHPESGITSPGGFLSLITKTDLEIELGQWVIDQALLQLSQWRDIGVELPVSVNISAHHLQYPGFVGHLRELFARYKEINPDMLELEILETASIEDTNVIYHALSDCREMGVKISLDDFGTGYSSLAYFHRLPVDILKIDQNFVQDMLDDPQDLTIVDSVVRLAHAFQHPVIAEGVESIEHASALLQLGCRLGQGFGIAKPMPADEIPLWLEQWKTNRVWQSLKNRVTQSYHIDIEVALSSHRRWIKNLIGHVTQDRELNHGQLDSKHCNFNYWFNGIGFIQYGDHPQYSEISRLHEQIHSLGYKIISIKNMGNIDYAKHRITELEALCHRFAELMEGLDNPQTEST